MTQPLNSSNPGLFSRIQLGFGALSRAISDPAFATRLGALISGAEPASPTPSPVPPAPKPAPVAAVPPTPVPAAGPAVAVSPERQHASGLLLLSILQREGRLVDFLQDDVSAYSDADVGAAARVVHAGCRKALAQCVTLEPARKDGEGAVVTLPAGFDAQRVRLTGNVAGNPPFKGTLRHQGWVASAVHFPVVAASMDPRVIAPAEVEL